MKFQNVHSHGRRSLPVTYTHQGKRVFIKDMAYYLMPPDGKHTQIAPSLGGGVEAGNPTNLPLAVLRNFHFTFLIRHPRRSIPSYWRCTIPPLSDINGFDHFMPNEAGYAELVRLFDFLVNSGLVDRDQLTVVDADDMLDNPEHTIREYCRRTDIDFCPEMLEWNEDDKKYAEMHFAKWNGFHNDALNSYALRGRTRAQVSSPPPRHARSKGSPNITIQKESTVESENEEWKEKYGAEAQKIIRATVDANIPHYEYLKQFCIGGA